MVKAKEDAVGGDRRRSVSRCLRRHRPKSLPGPFRRPTAETVTQTEHTRVIQRRAPEDACLLDQTVHSKSRVVPAHTTAEQPLRAGQAVPPEGEQLAPRATPDRGQGRLATTAPDPPHGSITDGARQQTGCATRGLQATSPEGSAAKETARSEGPTTPPMGFGAFRRSQPW